MLLATVFVIGAYLLGSVASAIVTCRLLGLTDPRTLGSGNPGATNVLRTGHKAAAALTLTGDLLKGLVPVALARLLALPEPVIAGVGLAALLGHLYPLYFQFKGGKGVATMLGVLMGLNVLAGALTALSWLTAAALFRYSSLAALIAMALAPVYLFLMSASGVYTSMTLVMITLVYWRHSRNIRSLLQGEEGRIGQASQGSAASGIKAGERPARPRLKA